MSGRHFLPALALPLLTACGSMQYTVDDQRPIDAAKLAAIKAYGQGSVVLQEAVARTAARPAECEKAWALPFAVASSDQLPVEDRIAWVRALQVDERPTVIAAASAAGLAVGERLAEVDGYHSDQAQRMFEALEERREAGRPFRVKTAAGRVVTVAPLPVCRGLARIALPAQPTLQDYHWRQTTHPLEVFTQGLNADEALWVVLWTQGLSEEGGARMKAYKYGLAPLRVLFNIATVVTGAGALARTGQGAVANEAGAVVAKGVATSVATSVAVDVAKEQAMAAASKNRASLEGVSWAAGTVFDKADKWAFARMSELGADPLAPFTLHRKLAEQGSFGNAFVLDAERLPALQALAEPRLGSRVADALYRPSQAVMAPSPAAPGGPARDPLAELALSDMPQAVPGNARGETESVADALLQSVPAMPRQTIPGETP